MAEIYSKASRVIVWLGEGQDGSDKALEEACLVADEMSKSSSIRPQAKELFLKVLDNPWFERIWVLQEVAAARHVIIKWGPTEVDGYAFCMALSSQELGLLVEASASVQRTASSVTFLIRGAAFRPKRVPIPLTGNFSLSMRPLGELINLYHTRRATILHDKVFALLGMSSDDPMSAGIVPDYKLPWKTLFESLIRFLLGQRISVRTWNDAEMAVVKGRGHIIGVICDDQSRTYGGRTYQAAYVKDEFGRLEPLDEWDPSHSIKSVQAGDMICLMEEAPNPMVLRPHWDFFSIIMIMASNLKIRSQFRGSVLKDLFLVWDWSDTTVDPEDRQLYETFMKIRGFEYVETELSCHLDSVKRVLSMVLALEEAEEPNAASERLTEYVKFYERHVRDDGPHTRECESSFNELCCIENGHIYRRTDGYSQFP